MKDSYTFNIEITNTLNKETMPPYIALAFSQMDDASLTKLFKEACEQMLSENLFPKANENATYATLSVGGPL